jgi:hypothetical protein
VSCCAEPDIIGHALPLFLAMHILLVGSPQHRLEAAWSLCLQIGYAHIKCDVKCNRRQFMVFKLPCILQHTTFHAA